MGENIEEGFVQQLDGTKIPVKHRLVERLEEPKSSADSCYKSYVSCKDKTTKVLALKKGDRASVHAWENEQCIQKEFTCP